MSGITPILDTLLHQVLGRRDAPAGRPLPDQLIAPPRAGLPPPATHSDSRLDPRPLPASRAATGAGGKVGNDTAAVPRTAIPSRPGQAAAVTTRFSVAARVIADVLTRFPASPAIIRAQAPLVIAAERMNVAQLAALLRDSIESSGLFYEAHLLRWRGGTFPLAQLLREPQMSWTARTPLPQQPPPAATASQDNAPVPAVASSARAPADVTHANSAAGDTAVTSTRTPAGMPQAYGADGKPLPNLPVVAGGDPGHSIAQAGGQPPPLTGSHQVVHPALEGVLRHQLEMLAAPVLRWEGAPWAGVLMALVLQPPPCLSGQGQARDGRESRQDDDVPWQTHLTLRLARLGEVKVNLQLGAQRVALDLEAEPAVADPMRAASDTLRDRLVALGFPNVALRIRTRDGEAAHE